MLFRRVAAVRSSHSSPRYRRVNNQQAQKNDDQAQEPKLEATNGGSNNACQCLFHWLDRPNTPLPNTCRLGVCARFVAGEVPACAGSAASCTCIIRTATNTHTQAEYQPSTTPFVHHRGSPAFPSRNSAGAGTKGEANNSDTAPPNHIFSLAGWSQVCTVAFMVVLPVCAYRVSIILLLGRREAGDVAIVLEYAHPEQFDSQSKCWRHYHRIPPQQPIVLPVGSVPAGSDPGCPMGHPLSA